MALRIAIVIGPGYEDYEIHYFVDYFGLCHVISKYSIICLKRTSVGQNSLSALDRSPLCRGLLIWHNRTKIRLDYTSFLYTIILTNKRGLKIKKLRHIETLVFLRENHFGRYNGNDFEFRHLMLVYRHEIPRA